ncbi:hypothetical protein ABK040_001550 [Willaertia magna]
MPALQEELLHVLSTTVKGHFEEGHCRENYITNNKNGDLFYFSKDTDEIYIFKEYKLLSEDNRTKRLKTATKFKKIKLFNTHPKIIQILSNKKGNRLLFIGENDISIIKVPDYNLINEEEETFCEMEKIFSYRESKILKVMWHPLSDEHFVVLTSNNILKMIHIIEGIEQEISLQKLISKPKFGYSLNDDEDNEEEEDDEFALSFCFGALKGWERFTLFYVTNKSKFYAICPFLPNNCIIHESFILEVIEQCENDNERELVKSFWNSIISKSSSGEDALLTNYFLVNQNVKALHLFEDNRRQLLELERNDENDLLIEDICDIALLNAIGKFPSCLACVSMDGKVQLFVLGDEFKPKWNRAISSNQRTTTKGLLNKRDSITEGKSHVIIARDLVDLQLMNVRRMVLKRPYLFPHPTISGLVYCLHSMGAHEIKFPLVSSIETLFTLQEESLESISEPSAIPITSPNDSPMKGFTVLVDEELESSVVCIDSHFRASVIDVNILFSGHSLSDKRSSSSSQPPSLISSLEGIITQIGSKMKISPTFDETTSQIDRISNNDLKKFISNSRIFRSDHQVLSKLIEMLKDRLLTLSKLHHEQQEKVNELSMRNTKLTKKQTKVEEAITQLRERQKEQSLKAKKLFNGVCKPKITKAEQGFISNIKQIDQSLLHLNNRLNNLSLEQQKLETQKQLPQEGSFTETQRIMIQQYVEKTTKILKESKEVLEKLQSEQ